MSNIDFQKNFGELAALNEKHSAARREADEIFAQMEGTHAKMGEDSADRETLRAEYKRLEARLEDKNTELSLLRHRKEKIQESTAMASVIELENGNMRPMMEVNDALGILAQASDSSIGIDADTQAAANASLQKNGKYFAEVTAGKTRFRPDMTATRTGAGSDISFAAAIPTFTNDEFYTRLKAWGGATAAVSTQVVTTGNSLVMPAIDFTGKVAVDKNEGAAAATAALSPVTSVTLLPRQKETGVIPISRQTIRDSAPAVLPMAFMQVESMLGRKVNTDLTNGTGNGANGTPQGISSGAAVGKAQATFALKFGDIIDLEHSVNAAYRRMDYGSLSLGEVRFGNIGFMGSDNVLAQIRKLEDGQDRPLFIPIPLNESGVVGRVMGYDYYVNEDLPAWGQESGNTARRVLWFGNFGYYLHLRVSTGEYIDLYQDSPYASAGNVGLQGFGEFTGAYVGAFDGNSTTCEAVKCLTVPGDGS